MSYFYSSIQGGRGEATRCGTKRDGIRASVQSYDGSIGTYLSDVNGKVYATIRVGSGSTQHPSITLYEGPLVDLLEPGGRLTLLRNAARDSLRDIAAYEPSPEAQAYFDHIDARADA